METKNIKIKGIKKAIKTANTCPGDKWIIVFDTEDYSVFTHQFFSNDVWQVYYPYMVLAKGNGNSVFGREKTTIKQIKDLAQEAIKIKLGAIEEYKKGLRHYGNVERYNETLSQFVMQELSRYFS